MFKYLIFIIALFFINIANSQDTLLTLKQQLDRLQRDVNDLSKSVFTAEEGDINSPTKNLNNQLNLSTFDLRIYDLEKDIKKLNENFEELVFKIDDLKKMYEEFSLNLDTKLINNNSE